MTITPAWDVRLVLERTLSYDVHPREQMDIKQIIAELDYEIARLSRVPITAVAPTMLHPSVVL